MDLPKLYKNTFDEDEQVVTSSLNKRNKKVSFPCRVHMKIKNFDTEKIIIGETDNYYVTSYKEVINKKDVSEFEVL